MKPLLEQAPVVRTATASLPKTAAASVQIVDPLAVADWDALVMSLPGHSFFHSSAWARALEESYGYKPMYFAKVENGELRALLPMMEVDSWLTGKRGVSLPFSDICEPLVGAPPARLGLPSGPSDSVGRVPVRQGPPRAPSDEKVGPAVLSGPSTESELFQAAIEHGRSRGWKYVETRGSGTIAANTSPSESFHGHTLELSRDEEKIFAGFESSVRRAIRKADKEGVKVEISRSLEGVKQFYGLHCLTRQKHGVPPQPFAFFANFHRHILAHNLGMVVIARLNGQPIAASVFVHFGTKAIYKYGASDEKFQNFRGANVVMWHAIQWYARAGFDQLDFGRTDIGHEGLRRFKLGWGATERPINYFKYDLRAQRFTEGKGASSSLMRERVFKHVPIPIARIVGSVLYRHVA